MALFRYPNSKVWWYDFKFNGRRIRESTKSRSKTVAGDAERARRRQLEENFNNIAPKQTAPTLTAAADDLIKRKEGAVSKSTLRMIKDSLRLHVLPALGNKLVTEITAADLKDYQRSRLAAGTTPRGVNIELTPVRTILLRFKCWENIRHDFRMLATPPSRGIALTHKQEKTLLAACKRSRARSLHTAVLMALCTGMRRSEIRFLRWFQVDLKGDTITVGDSKTEHGARRVIPINRRLKRALVAWAAHFPARTPEQYVFPFERYGSSGHLFRESKPVPYATNPNKPYGSWRTGWRSAQRSQGIRCRFHDLRHTACSRMLEAGVPLPVVASIMGWSATTTADMAKRYGHMSDEAKAKAVRAMDEPKRTVRR